MLDGYGFDDDALDEGFVGFVSQVREEEAGEIRVHALVAGDEFVGEGQAGHETAFFEPEDCREGAREEDSFYRREGDEAAGEGRVFVGDPSQGPVGLLTDAGDVVDGVEEVGALLGLADVGVDEEGVGLGVDVLHHDLEAVEAAGFGDLHFAAEALDEVLVDDAVGGGEEGEDVGDEEALVVVEALVPVVEIFR